MGAFSWLLGQVYITGMSNPIIPKVIDSQQGPPGRNHHQLNLHQLSNPKTYLDKQPSHLSPTFKSPK
jgi:hypothetical protein